MEHLNPRGARVVALRKPTAEEDGEWYFQRYIRHLPTAGEIVFFDRSWYNRAGVEQVMSFCSPNEYLEFMRQAPELERMLVRSGVHLLKYWCSITQAEQRRRFAALDTDPLKWQPTNVDLAALDRWEEYSEAKDAMFFYTDTTDAPWTVVRADDKKRAELECIRHFLARIDYPGKDVQLVSAPDPKIVYPARRILRRADRIVSRPLGGWAQPA